MRRSFGLLKILLCVGLSCMCLFLAVGYAAVSGTLSITGTAKYEPGTIYITKVLQGGDKFQKFGYLTLLGNCSLGSEVVKVEVKNNSGIDQYFDYVEILADSPQYVASTVLASTNKNAHGQLLKNGDTETYIITFKSKSGTVTLNNAHNILRFTPDYDDLTGVVATNISERFLQILNQEIQTLQVGETIYTAEEFSDKMAELMGNKDADSGGYISNVAGADPDDSKIVDTVFGEFTSIKLESTADPIPVKGLIKEQNVTGDSTPEMVLYITADPLDKGGYFWSPNRVPVYAIVFEQQDRKWVQKKAMLAGTAPVTDYDGNFSSIFRDENGSFSTDYWQSTNGANIADTYAAADVIID